VYLASSYPKHQTAFETLAGVLLLAGLALMGYGLEAVLGQPLRQLVGAPRPMNQNIDTFPYAVAAAIAVTITASVWLVGIWFGG
jgi:hypothetical protein